MNAIETKLQVYDDDENCVFNEFINTINSTLKRAEQYPNIINLTHIFISVLEIVADESEVRLMRHLMTTYDPAVRPAEISALPLNVTFGVSLHHIIDVVSDQNSKPFRPGGLAFPFKNP